MSNQPSAERARAVQEMFQRIAPRYDLMNRLMTGGQDVRWRKMVVRLAALPPRGRLLDLGAGTGDLAREASRQYPGSEITAADFTVNMMRAGREAHPNVLLDWSAADALHLPFPDASFDAVISGFLLRNVVDLPRALSEQMRVLKPNGRIIALDTTRPKPTIVSPLIRFHMRRVIPWLGGMLTGEHAAYRYLPSTSEAFLTAEQLQSQLQQAGFREVQFRRLMFGTVAIHWAIKP